MHTKITGSDDATVADVVDDSGVNRLQVSMVGNATVIPGGIGRLFLLNGQYSGSSDMRVDGSVTPKTFALTSDTVDLYVYEIRIFALCNGIQFTRHLCKPAPLTNGIEIKIKSEDTTLTMPIIKTTEDYKNKFSSAGLFRIDLQAGADGLLAIFKVDTPFIIKKTGTYATDDYVNIKIQDDLTGSAGGNLAEFSSIYFGFKGD